MAVVSSLRVPIPRLSFCESKTNFTDLSTPDLKFSSTQIIGWSTQLITVSDVISRDLLQPRHRVNSTCSSLRIIFRNLLQPRHRVNSTCSSLRIIFRNLLQPRHRVNSTCSSLRIIFRNVQHPLHRVTRSTGHAMSGIETNNTLLSPDAVVLEKRRVIGPIKNGKRNFSELSVSSSTSLTSEPDSGIDANEFEEIPAVMVSQETLEFLGFDIKASKMMWDLFIDWKDFEFGLEKPSLEEVAVMSIRDKNTDAENESDDWDHVMQSWGICEHLRKMILLQEYTDIRLTESAKFWVMAAIQGRAYRLRDIYEKSRTRHQRKQKRRRENPSSSEEYIPEDLEVPQDSSSKVSLRGGASEGQPDIRESTLGTTTLWRGTSREQAELLLRTNDIKPLYATPPSDFRGRPGEITYFTPQRQVAVRYAHYCAKHIGGNSEARLIQIDVPNSFIDKLKPLLLLFDEKQEHSPQTSLFKEIVWWSRMGEHLPRHLSEYVHRPLYVGHISHSKTCSIRQLPGWQDVTRRHLLDVEEEYFNEKLGEYELKLVLATQYFFNGREAMESLLREGKSQVVRLKET